MRASGEDERGESAVSFHREFQATGSMSVRTAA